MSQVALIGQLTTDSVVITTPNTFITINGRLVDTLGSISAPHNSALHPLTTRSDIFTIPLQTYVTINGQPILTIGAGGLICPSFIIPNPTNGQAQQNFIFIN